MKLYASNIALLVTIVSTEALNFAGNDAAIQGRSEALHYYTTRELVDALQSRLAGQNGLDTGVTILINSPTSQLEARSTTHRTAGPRPPLRGTPRYPSLDTHNLHLSLTRTNSSIVTDVVSLTESPVDVGSHPFNITRNSLTW